MSGGRRVGWLLGLVLGASFVLRLVYALPDLGPRRFWDERYGFENIERLLAGDPRPAQGFHPALSYLPQALVLWVAQGVHQATGIEALAIRGPDGEFTATAYLLCRLLQIVFATLGLYLLFLVGRRLGGARLGLLACLLLSVVPWHVRQSAVFKADVVLLLALTLAFWLALRAVEERSVRSFALAGAGIGLALASKFNGGPIAVPLAVGALLAPGSRRRALAMLALAATVSVAVFVALDPYVVIEPEIYRSAMSGTLRTYKYLARQAGSTRALLPWHAVRTALSPDMHGPWIGTAALAGLAWLTVRAARGRPDRDAARRWLMAVSFVVAYVGLYALSTPKADPHNWLPLGPFLALAAAWLLSRLWDWLAPRTGAAARRPLALAAVGLLVTIAYVPALRFTYRGAVPSASEVVLGLLRSSRPHVPRLVVTEHDFVSESWRGKRGLALAAVDALPEISARLLDHADAEVFPASRLAGPAGDFYRLRMARVAVAAARTIEPEPFRVWGEPLVVVSHPFRPVAMAQRVDLVRSGEDPRLFVGRLPARPHGAVLVTLEYEAGEEGRRGGELLVGKARLRTEPLLGRNFGWRRTTPRFRYRREVRLRLDRPPRIERLPAVVRWWRRGPAPS